MFYLGITLAKNHGQIIISYTTGFQIPIIFGFCKGEVAIILPAKRLQVLCGSRPVCIDTHAVFRILHTASVPTRSAAINSIAMIEILFTFIVSFICSELERHRPSYIIIYDVRGRFWDTVLIVVILTYLCLLA